MEPKWNVKICIRLYRVYMLHVLMEPKWNVKMDTQFRTRCPFVRINGTKVECKVGALNAVIVDICVLMEPQWNVKFDASALGNCRLMY